jgi:ATP-binding cassette, subfamily F, member 3
MRAKDVLLEAIESFSGTVIFVSHDRYFLDRLATKVMEVKDGGVVVYPGNYAEFVRDEEERAAKRNDSRLSAPAAVASAAPMASGASVDQDSKMVESSTSAPKERAKKLNPIKLKQMEDRCAFLEEEVPRIEASIAHTEGALGSFVSVAETERQSALLEGLREQLAVLTAEWEELMMALEEQEAFS